MMNPVTGNQTVTACRSSRASRRRAAGVTLIELLITLVVLSLGLLGIAALQGRSLFSTNDAYLYSQAAGLAYDMAERMRFNPKRANQGRYDTDFGQNEPNHDCESSNCNDNNLAKYDLYQWKENLVKRLLPSGDAKITTSGNVSTITLRWVGRGGGNCDEDGNMGGEYTCFTLTIEPRQ